MTPPWREGSGLRWSLRTGAALWLALLAVGFFAPGGWTWGLAGPFGHVENFMIALWVVTLVLAPLLASVDPLARTPAIQVYILGVAGIVLSSLRAEPLELLSDAPQAAIALLTVGLLVWAHPDRSCLWRLADS
jgi:hypothetical protein